MCILDILGIWYFCLMFGGGLLGALVVTGVIISAFQAKTGIEILEQE